jgi:subtilase family serine protease
VRSRLGIAAFMLAAVASIFCVTTRAQTVMTHHLQAPLRSAVLQPVGKLPSTQIMTLDVVLPLRDPAGLENFLTLVSTPGSPSYRQFLTPAQFANMFGPTQTDYDTVVAFLKTNGFNVYGGGFLSREIQVKAPVSVIESTFHVSMNVYQHPTENRTFFSADREPTTNLPFPLWHITGLDNYSIPKPRLVNRDDFAKAHGISPQSVTPNATTGSGPSASYLGSDMRAAYYSASGGTLTGAGQNLGLLEYYGTDLVDLTTYFTNVAQTNNVPIVLRSTDGTSTACVYTNAGGYCDDGEQNLDMTQAIGMAPGLANLTMYVGSLDTAIIGDMVTHYPLPTTIGCSWGWTPSDPASIDPYFQQMAAQGQNFFVASGDDSTWKKSGNAEAWPADDANIVSVGGTSLTTASAAGPWKAETVWTDSGGGISPDAIPIPSWQTAAGIITTTNKGSTTLRNGPDVSANADFTFYTCGDQQKCQANYYGGTSFAAPMWAGYMALVNQGIAAKSGSTLGFLNPLIYSENLNATTYAANFHDILSGTSGSYSANAGYDLVTGWGSPTQALATTLIGTPSGTADFFLTTPTIAYTAVVNGTTLTDNIDVTSRYGFTGAVALSCVGTGGITCSLSPASTTLTSNATNVSVLSIVTSGVAKTGTYTATVTGAGSSGNHTIVISVAVIVPNFTIAATTTAITPTTTTFTDGITLTSTYTFTGAVNLTCAGSGGITCSLAPPSVTLTSGGTGTSTLTMVDTGVNAPGVYNVVVTGTDAATGKIVNSVSIAVTIPQPDFTITAAPTSFSTPSAVTLTDTISLASTSAFSQTVALTCYATGGITCSFSTTSSPLGSLGTASSTLTINTQNVKTVGSYLVIVTGTSAVTGHSAGITVNVTSIPPQAFVITNAGDIIIPTQGASAKTDLIITPNGTFASPVTLTCAIISTPAGANYVPTCSVPTSVVIAQGTTNYTAFLTINTTAQTLQGSIPVKPIAWLAGGLFLALLLVPTRRRRRLPMLAVLLVSGLLLANAVGCGSKHAPVSINSPSYAGGTTLGGYVVSVTGTSGSSTSTTTLKLTVN